MPIFARLKRPKAGDRISAADQSELIDAIEALQQAIRDPDGQMVQAMLARMAVGSDTGLLYPARISAVNVGTPNPNSISGRPAYTPSTVTYDVLGIGLAGLELSAATPHYGRPTRYDDALIHPARVKDMCFIETFRDSATGNMVSRLGLLPGSEVIARKVCATAPS